MKKKLLSLVMAIAMTLSLAAPAFAASNALFYQRETDAEKLKLTDQSVTIEALTFVPTISLAMPVPPTNPLVLNPYKLSFSGNSKIGTMNVNAADATAQVICPVYTIENKSNAVLKFDVSATTTPAGALSLKDDVIALDANSTDAHVVLVFSKTEQTAAEVANYGKNTNPQIFLKEDVPSGEALDSTDTGKYETITLKSGEAKCDPDIERTLAAATQSGNTITANYLPFQFQGDLARNPDTAWMAADNFTCVVKFTFNPDSAQDFVWYNNSTTGKETVYVESTALAKLDAGITDNIEYNLPDKDSTAITAGPFNTWAGNGSTATRAMKFKVGGTDVDATPTFSTEDPSWSVVSGGQAYGADISSDGKKLVFDKETLKELKEGSVNTANIILGYLDVNEIPRTMAVKVQVTRAS